MRAHRQRATLFGLVALLASACSTNGGTDANDSAEGILRWMITTTVEIDAPPARVWSVLVDLPAYREWNPFIVEAAGTVAAGETLSLRMALPGRAPMSIEPQLLVVAPERELRWKGRLILPGLFD